MLTLDTIIAIRAALAIRKQRAIEKYYSCMGDGEWRREYRWFWLRIALDTEKARKEVQNM